MTIRMIPDLLKNGDKQLGLPRKGQLAKNVGMIGTAIPHCPNPYAFPHRQVKAD